MNERNLRPGTVAAAAMVIGGVLMIALPQHGVSIVRLVMVTVAAAAVLYALAVSVPEWSVRGASMSPFDRTVRPERKGRGSAEIDRIHSELSGRRQRIGHGPPVPSAVLRHLKRLIKVALERDGLGPADGAQHEFAHRPLSPLTRAVLTAKLLDWPTWFRTVRPNEREVAEVVHRVLDDLERLGAGDAGSRPHIDATHPRMT